MAKFKNKYLISFFIIIFSGRWLFSSISTTSMYDNLFESKDYVILFKMSVNYSKYREEIASVIESKKYNKIKIKDIKNINNMISDTISKLDSIENNVKNTDIRSQIYQTRIELENTKKLVNNTIKSVNNKDKFKSNLIELESSLFRIEVYLKGLSQKISVL
ncbi:MAG: hypothetical protein GX445_02485 [Elusimicrobia bacterium]|jgi:hypothetical protein|nr:hypothetical protein [Elusimicrobiota bacterium]